MRTGSKLWIGAVVCLTLAQVAASAFLPRGVALTTVSDFSAALIMLALLLAFAQNAAPTGGRLRVFWVMQSVAWSILLADQAWWMVYDLILQKPVPLLFAGDVLLFLPGVLMLAGFLLRPHLQLSERSARLGALDFLLLMLWWLFCYVVLVMSWKYVSVNTALYNRNFDRLYQLQFLLLVIVLGVLLKRSAGAWKVFFGYFFLGMLFHGLSVIAENHAVDSKVYYNGCWLDIPFVASLAFFLLVAIKGRNLPPAAMRTKREIRRVDGKARCSSCASRCRWWSSGWLVKRECPERVLHFRV